MEYLKTTIWMKLWDTENSDKFEGIILNERNQAKKKGHILYNSVCVKCPEWANPQAAE